MINVVLQTKFNCKSKKSIIMKVNLDTATGYNVKKLSLHGSFKIIITLCLFRWKTLCKNSFPHFPTFRSIKKKLVNEKLSLVNKKP